MTSRPPKGKRQEILALLRRVPVLQLEKLSRFIDRLLTQTGQSIWMVDVPPMPRLVAPGVLPERYWEYFGESLQDGVVPLIIGEG
jgi:hypothetical protein